MNSAATSLGIALLCPLLKCTFQAVTLGVGISATRCEVVVLAVAVVVWYAVGLTI